MNSCMCVYCTCSYYVLSPSCTDICIVKRYIYMEPESVGTRGEGGNKGNRKCDAIADHIAPFMDGLKGQYTDYQGVLYRYIKQN